MRIAATLTMSRRRCVWTADKNEECIPDSKVPSVFLLEVKEILSGRAKCGYF